jgi:hypothetical protein
MGGSTSPPRAVGVSILDLHGRQIAAVGNDHLADGAHVVAVNPETHRSFYPIARGADGRPALREYQPEPVTPRYTR